MFSLTLSHGVTYPDSPHEGACPLNQDCPWAPSVRGDTRAAYMEALFAALAAHCKAHAEGAA